MTNTEKVLNALNASEEAMTTAEVARAAGLSAGEAGSLLGALKSQSRVKVTGTLRPQRRPAFAGGGRTRLNLWKAAG